MMCYCDSSERQIFDDIKRLSIPSDALIRSCCWKKICQVRGSFGRIDDEAWREICRKRGYLFRRENPRGF